MKCVEHGGVCGANRLLSLAPLPVDLRTGRCLERAVVRHHRHQRVEIVPVPCVGERSSRLSICFTTTNHQPATPHQPRSYDCGIICHRQTCLAALIATLLAALIVVERAATRAGARDHSAHWRPVLSSQRQRYRDPFLVTPDGIILGDLINLAFVIWPKDSSANGRSRRCATSSTPSPSRLRLGRCRLCRHRDVRR